MRHAYKSAAPSLGHPTEGEPSTNIPATVPGPYWFDSVTSEIVAVIEAAGLTPNDTQVQLLAAIRQIARSSMPAGSLIAYAGATVPSGFLACDGSQVSRTTYAALYTAIGTTYGSGDGSTTFHLPDLARRTVIGAGGTGSSTIANTVGATGGEEGHTLTSDEMPSHNHGGATGWLPGHTHGAGTLTTGSGGAHSHTFTVHRWGDDVDDDGDYNVNQGGPDTDANLSTSSSGSHNHTITGSTAANSQHRHALLSSGGGGSHNNMPPSVVMQWIISTG